METEESNSQDQFSDPSENQDDQMPYDLADDLQTSASGQLPQTETPLQSPSSPANLVCPHCQQEHPAGSKFCPDTGRPIQPESQPSTNQTTPDAVQQGQAYIPPPQPPYPGTSQRPYDQQTYPPPIPPYYQPRPPKDRNTALVLEILPGLFGILGIGWIYSGKTSTGIAWLIGYLVWVAIAIIAAVITGSMACFCTVPINLICVGISAYYLNSYAKSNPQLFGP